MNGKTSGRWRSWSAWWGIELSAVSRTEKFVSIAGGFLAIFLLLEIGNRFFPGPAVVASMGASAVLLFAVPHGQLSQPWPVIAGHGFSALIGVCCARWLGVSPVSGAVAVALSIGAMHQFKCIHPPGGATALTAVLGGPLVQALGFRFVGMPVIANAGVMVASAVIYNSFFAWRKFPASLNRREGEAAMDNPAIPSHEEIVSAIRSLDSFVDITEDDLVRLIQLIAERHALIDDPKI